ncbi:hypothetical protein KR044_007076, partial [Drosophila immigrans]
MQTCNEVVGLENLNQELKNVEKILQKADEYNDTLTKHVDKLRAVVSSNQKVFQKLRVNEESLKEILNDEGDDKERIYNKLIEKVGTIENRLFVTVNLFNEYKRRVKDESCVQDDKVEARLCNQINSLGANLHSIGQQITVLRVDRKSKERELANHLDDGYC